MKRSVKIFAATVLFGLACSCGGRKDALPRADREMTETFVVACDSAFDWLNGFGVNEVHSLMVLKDGKVAYERYGNGHDENELHVMWSATKTFTATAVGFAVQDGLMSVDDKVISFFSDDELPAERHPYLEQLTVKDLLIMSSGFSSDILNIPGSRFFEHGWTKRMLATDFYCEPGKLFSYNSGNSYLLSDIVGRVTGRRLDDYLTEKLFTPLGIRDFRYEITPDGVAAGGWGLFMSLESFAKMGQFMLQKGVWQGKRLLAEEWFDEAMSCQILQYEPDKVTPEQEQYIRESEGTQGYGYQMWLCTHNAIRLDGAWGQLCIIIPDRNAVIATFSHTGAAESHIKAFWKYIYPLL